MLSMVATIAIFFGKIRGRFNNAKTALDEASVKAIESNTAIENNTEEVRKLKKRNEELKEEIKLENLKLINSLIDNFKVMQENNEEVIAHINSLVEQLKPLLNLPKAFLQSIASNKDLVENGTAKKISDTMGFNNDNIVNSTTEIKETTIDEVEDKKVGE